jgi:hypothetical protein
VQVRHLIDAISKAQGTTLATLEDAAAVAELLDAERESVLSGSQVVINKRQSP